MAENEAQVKFGGDATGAIEAAKKAAEAVKSSVDGMRSSLDSLKSQFGLVTQGFAAITAAVAGGSALKRFVSDADAVTKAAQGMGKSLGISTTDASYFGVALEKAGVSSDAVALAGKRVTMALAQGGEKFAALGVQTKDANGQFRNSRDIMLDVNSRLRDFKEGTDRNIEAMKIYGRSYADLMPFINKFKGETEASRKLAEDLNLVVGQESVDASIKYAQAKRGLDQVFKGIERTIGDALIPRLGKMAEFFSSEGPAAVSVMRGVMSTYLVVQDAVGDALMALWDAGKQVFSAIGNAINAVFGAGSTPMTGMKFFANVLAVIKTAVIVMRVVVQGAFTAVGGYIELLVDTLRSLGEVADSVLSGKGWNGAVQAWQSGVERRVQIVKAGAQRMLEIAVKGGKDIDAALMGDATAKAKVTATKDPRDAEGKSATVKSKDAKDKATKEFAVVKAGIDAELALRKEAEAEAMKIIEDAHSRELLSDREFYERKAVFQREVLDAEISGKQAEAAQVQKERQQVEAGDLAKANTLKAQAIKLEGELVVLSMKRSEVGAETARAIAKAEEDRTRKLDEQRISSAKTLADLEITSREQSVSAMRALGEITAAQELEMQRQLQRDKYMAERDALEARLLLAKNNAQDRAKISDDMAALEARNTAAMAKNASDMAVLLAKPMLDFKASMQTNFQAGLDSMFDRTRSWMAKLKGLWVSLATSFVQIAVTQPVAEWAAGEATKLATSSGVLTAMRSMLGLSVAEKKLEAANVIPAEAAMAAGAAASSVAGIPVVGPEMAAAAYSETMAMVMSGLSVASARGGYDIPAGVNPLTQLHEREMVLPAREADAVRDMAEGAGGGSGVVNISISTIDANGVKDFMMKHRHAVASAAQRATRDKLQTNLRGA
jgi:hypothetical protein